MRPLLLVLLSAFATAAAAQSVPDLPDIGNPAGAIVTQTDEYQIGRMIVRGLRDQNQIVEDPEINEYVQTLGSRIAAQSSDDGQRFQFFVVRDPTINAFALPGGFIGVNLGLVLATQNESELAGVLAHEIAHVTQRHIARTIRAQGRQSLTSAAAILAAILIGAAGGSGDAVMGAIAAAQGAAAQQQINFTRANEYEADRVGIGFMASAGFDPRSMADFFETMGRRAGLAEVDVPELLLTHPVSRERIGEARNRAAQMSTARDRHSRNAAVDSHSYAMVRERLRVLGTANGTDPAAYYTQKNQSRARDSLGERYGEAVALIAANKPAEAVKILEPLVDRHEGSILLYTALGQAQMSAGMTNDGLSTFAQAMKLFPRNVPITVRYAEALMASNRAKEAHAVLLDLFNNVAPTPDQIRFTALVASSAGDTGDAYYYMSEYHIASGDLRLAVQQLELALAAPNLTTVQRQRFQARLDEIREFLAANPPSRRQTEAEQEKEGRQ